MADIKILSPQQKQDDAIKNIQKQKAIYYSTTFHFSSVKTINFELTYSHRLFKQHHHLQGKIGEQNFRVGIALHIAHGAVELIGDGNAVLTMYKRRELFYELQFIALQTYQRCIGITHHKRFARHAERVGKEIFLFFAAYGGDTLHPMR